MFTNCVFFSSFFFFIKSMKLVEKEETNQNEIKMILLSPSLYLYTYMFVYIYIYILFTQPLRSGRIWHKVSF